jgi:hypothetical protein
MSDSKQVTIVTMIVIGGWEGRVLFTHPCDGCCHPLMHKEIEGGTSGR